MKHLILPIVNEPSRNVRKNIDILAKIINYWTPAKADDAP